MDLMRVLGFFLIIIGVAALDSLHSPNKWGSIFKDIGVLGYVPLGLLQLQLVIAYLQDNFRYGSGGGHVSQAQQPMRTHSVAPVITNPVQHFAQSACPPVVNGFYIGYHGTPSLDNARNFVKKGLKPGSGKAYGEGVYIALSLKDAKKYSAPGGAILKLYINSDANYTNYEDIPGNSPDEKRAWCLANNTKLVFIKEQNWFVVYGHEGIPVRIPGLKECEVLDHNGNFLL